MRSLKKKRRVQILMGAAVALVVATALIGYGFRDGINLYRSPAQVASEPPDAGEVFKLGGLVEEGSIRRGEGTVVTFAVTDTAATIPVRFEGILPDLFAEGQGMIGTGTLQDGVFVASDILAKHDENYMPREVIDTLEAQGVDVRADALPSS